jgi:tail assembly chaperone
MAEFEVGSNTYRTERRMAAREQWHVTRRLGPVLTAFKEIILAADERLAPPPPDASDDERQLAFARMTSVALDAAVPLAEAVAKMPNHDWDYVIDECFKVVVRAVKNENGGITSWQRLWNEAAGQPQFSDLDMLEMIQIVRHVLTENLSRFFEGLQSGLIRES